MTVGSRVSRTVGLEVAETGTALHDSTVGWDGDGAKSSSSLSTMARRRLRCVGLATGAAARLGDDGFVTVLSWSVAVLDVSVTVSNGTTGFGRAPKNPRKSDWCLSLEGSGMIQYEGTRRDERSAAQRILTPQCQYQPH